MPSSTTEKSSKKSQSRDAATSAIAAHILRNGLPQTSLRQLATAAGISDRMLLYYFSDKNDVMTSALGRIAHDMTLALNAALPDNTPQSASAVFDGVDRVIDTESMRPYMRVGVELAAAAVKGEPPYADIASAVIDGFVDWLSQRITGPDSRDKAAMVLAMLDGLAVLDVGGTTDMRQGARAAMRKMLD